MKFTSYFNLLKLLETNFIYPKYLQIQRTICIEKHNCRSSRPTNMTLEAGGRTPQRHGRHLRRQMSGWGQREVVSADAYRMGLRVYKITKESGKIRTNCKNYHFYTGAHFIC
jgi:hypothetical protein